MAFNSVKAYVLDCLTKLFGELHTRLSPVALSGKASDLDNDAGFLTRQYDIVAVFNSVTPDPNGTNVSGLIYGANAWVGVQMLSSDDFQEVVNAVQTDLTNLYYEGGSKHLTATLSVHEGARAVILTYNLQDSEEACDLEMEVVDPSKPFLLLYFEEDEDDGVPTYSLTVVASESIAGKSWTVIRELVLATSNDLDTKLNAYDAVISADAELTEKASFTVESGLLSGILDKLQNGYSVRVRVYASVANVDHVCKEFFVSKVQAGNNNSVLIGIYDFEEGENGLLAWTANGVAVD